MTFNSQIRIKVNSNAEKLAALTVLARAFNLPIGDVSQRMALEGIDRGYTLVNGGNYISIDADNVVSAYAGPGNQNFEFADISKAIEALKSSPGVIEVVLNDEYTAEVSNAGVKVGCQTFPLSVIDDLSKAKSQLK